MRRFGGLAAAAALGALACTEPTGEGDPVVVRVSPSSSTIELGFADTLSATVTRGSRDTIADAVVAWTARDEAIVTVTPLGVVVGVDLGSAWVVASVGEASDSTRITVVPRTVRRIDLSPQVADVEERDTVRLSALALDAAGQPLDVPVMWTVSDSTLASIDGYGLVTGQVPGLVTATARAGDRAANAVVTVYATYVSAAPSGSFTCALSRRGSAFCWGQNYGGALGNGTRAASAAPTRVRSEAVLTALTAGSDHACALGGQDTLVCWGLNDVGQLARVGPGPDVCEYPGSYDRPCALSPVARVLPVSLEGVDAGTAHTCGRAVNAETWCWGYRLDRSQPIANPDPYPVPGAPPFDTPPSGGGFHACAVAAGDLAHCWGWTTWGALGPFASEPTSVPVALDSTLRFRTVGTGDGFGCGVTVDDAVYCWGRNDYGQLGSAGVDGSPVPVPLPRGEGFETVEAGITHACGLTAAGDVWCWGYLPRRRRASPSTARSPASG
jgi:hypothetical protein